MKIFGTLDQKFIYFLRNYADEISRGALFILFFWFGVLKVLELSPAGPLVVKLLDVTFLGFLPPDIFVIWFGVFEVIVGFMILFPKLERITFALLLFHLSTTVMPLFMIPEEVWDGILVPNLTGQYIIKNVALLSLGLVLFARLRPMLQTNSMVGEEEEMYKNREY
ncbi:MAG: hypothetical protein K9L98_03305 [Candidatus Pacebacteria bacterium]|nr:hypothetical protein [Candidatus Paceibacterota bacterium]MCF7863007.1 hypothetical protein [Candidatus Paceibacterota bacterium]